MFGFCGPTTWVKEKWCKGSLFSHFLEHIQKKIFSFIFLFHFFFTNWCFVFSHLENLQILICRNDYFFFKWAHFKILRCDKTLIGPLFCSYLVFCNNLQRIYFWREIVAYEQFMFLIFKILFLTMHESYKFNWVMRRKSNSTRSLISDNVN